MKRSIVIFGTGQGGKNAIEWAREQGRLVGFLDNDKAMQGKTFYRLPVFNPEETISHSDWDIIIASEVYYNEMDTQLSKLGVDESRILFCPTSYLNGSRDFPTDLLFWTFGLLGVLAGLGYFLVSR